MIAIHLVPAYGRDYKSKAAVIADWKAGKDFKIADASQGRNDGAYTSRRDWPASQSFLIRYKRLEQVALVGGNKP